MTDGLLFFQEPILGTKVDQIFEVGNKVTNNYKTMLAFMYTLFFKLTLLG